MGVLPGATGRDSAAVGFAATIEDGNLGRRAGDVVAAEALRQLGLGEPERADRLAALAGPLIRDPRGEVSGEVRPAFRLGSTR
jgi:L-asparaginase II